MIWHGLQFDDRLLARVREGEAIMVGDVPADIVGVIIERLPLVAEPFIAFVNDKQQLGCKCVHNEFWRQLHAAVAIKRQEGSICATP